MNRSPDAGGSNSTPQEKYTSFHFVWPVSRHIWRWISYASIWYSRVISPKLMITYVFKIFLQQHFELWNTGQTEAFEDTLHILLTTLLCLQNNVWTLEAKCLAKLSLRLLRGLICVCSSFLLLFIVLLLSLSPSSLLAIPNAHCVIFIRNYT